MLGRLVNFQAPQCKFISSGISIFLNKGFINITLFVFVFVFRKYEIESFCNECAIVLIRGFLHFVKKENNF